MEPKDAIAFQGHRRTFLAYGASSGGLLALNSLPNPSPARGGAAGTRGSRGVVNPLDFPPKAKRVIFLYQAGGPSHLETFDYKPKLLEMNSKPMPDKIG